MAGEIDITLKKKKHTERKSSGTNRGGGTSTGAKKLKKTQGTGVRRKAYGPF